MRFTRPSLSMLLAALALTLLAGACGPLPETLFARQSERVRRLVILYTNDEHGWIEPSQETGGAAGMLERWRRDHGYKGGDPFLVLSGGDMWTGPAISTLHEGRSTTDVMNLMGYQAAAIGNHDFDFGTDALRARAEQAEFPFVSANLLDRQTGTPPGFAEPFVLQDVNGIRVGIVGLSTVETPVDTRPSYVQGLRLRPYEQALLEILPQIQQQQVDLILLIGHICHRELEGIVDVAQQYHIPLLGGGHCHEEHNRQLDGVRLIESGFSMRGYVKTELYLDLAAKRVVAQETQVLHNPPGPGAPEIEARVDHWREQLDPSYLEMIGYAAQPIDRRSERMDTLLTQAWLRAVPDAQVAMASRRYVAQSLPAGEITPASIVGVLPVPNELFRIQLSGEQLQQTINSRNPVLGGLVRSEEGLRFPGGPALDPAASYEVVLPDVIYYGANYYEVQNVDPTPVETGLDWVQPVVDYLRELESSRQRPLDQLLGTE